MKKIFWFILIITYSSLSGQSRISISALGGLNYIPMKDFSHYLNSYDKSEYDKIGFSGNLKLNYHINSGHSIYFGSEFISSNASIATGWVSVNWIFEAIPVTLGYEYFISGSESKWIPYLGIGASHVFSKNVYKYFGDDGSRVDNYFSNNIGFETKFGIERIISQNLIFIGEIKYRYIGDSNINKYTNIGKTNLSGISFLTGLKLNIL